MTLKFSKAMALAAPSCAVVISSAVLLYHLYFHGYLFGRVNLVPLAALSLLILWGVVNVMGCFWHDRSTSLTAHHREALDSDEGRPTDQP